MKIFILFESLNDLNIKLFIYYHKEFKLDDENE